MRWHSVLLAALCACGSSPGSTPDARPDGASDPDGSPGSDALVDGVPDAPIDAVPDAPVDAPPIPTVQACTGTPLLPTRAGVTLATMPTEVVSADLDGDGDDDLATRDTDGNITVLLANGDGTFVTTKYGVGNVSTQDLVAIDVDADGDRDLVTRTAAMNQIRIAINNGAGAFSEGPIIATANPPTSMAAGDLDGDGDADLVVGSVVTGTTSVTSSLAVYLRGPTGVFTPSAVALGTHVPGRIELADVDEDGDRDIVMLGSVMNGFVTTARSVDVLRSAGAGAFTLPMQSTAIAFEARELVTGDLDADGDADVIVTGPGHTLTFASAGDGTLAAPIEIAATSYRDLAIADMNGDGKVDIVGGGWVVSIFEGLGAGAFSAARTVAGNYEPHMAVGDFNDDGHRDVALALSSASAVELLFGNATGSLREFPSYIANGATQLAHVDGLAGADFDGDGWVDLAALTNTGATTSTLVILRNTAGVFNVVATRSITWSRSIITADIDADGRPDVISERDILRNTTSGWTVVSNVSPPAINPAEVATADVDLDGDLDLVYGGFQGVAVVHVITQGAFNIGTQMVQWGGQLLLVGLGDVDGDSRPDLVAQSNYTGTHLFLNDATGGFVDSRTFDLVSDALADVDGDGKLDLIGAGISRGHGDGTFDAPTPLDTDRNYFAGATPTDFDRDGDLDIFMMNGYGTMSLVRGSPSGFGPRVVWGTASQKNSYVLADFDRSGTLDVAASGYGNDVTLFFQTGCWP